MTKIKWECASACCPIKLLACLWYCFCRLSCQFSTTTKSAVIGGLFLWYINSWVIPSVQLRQALLERQYEALADIGNIRASYYQGIWNVYFGKLYEEDVQARRQYRDQLQQASGKAESMRLKLKVLFKDQTVSEEWAKAMSVYHTAYYPIGEAQSKEKLGTEIELEAKLTPATEPLESLIKKIATEMGR